MRVALTGTPGTGKTTVADLVETELPVIHLNDVIREADLVAERDTDRGSLVADMDAVADWLEGRDGLVESHLAHHFRSDRVIVLRCHPEALESRLRERGEPDAMVSENAESEALDVLLTEAVEAHGQDRVYEIDTTERAPEAVARKVEAVLAGTREPSAGEVDFIDYL